MPTHDFSYIRERDIRQKVEVIARNYNPKKTLEVNVKMTLILKNDVPVYQRPRRLSQPEREKERQLKIWLDDGIIRPSVSEYASPIVLVKKKGGDTRICVDYRKLNQKIVKDRYPLLLVEDQLDQLQGAKIFSVLDLKNGFFSRRCRREQEVYVIYCTERSVRIYADAIWALQFPRDFSKICKRSV